MKYKYLFGPIPSRRLGISLGVDIVPYKICNLNCVYCESGKTTRQINKQEFLISYDDLIIELDDYLSTKPELDFITFSGAGEPTLNLQIGEIISYIKTHYSNYKIAVITNGILLKEHSVRKQLLNADLIMPSLDGVSEDVFRKINRPTRNANIKEIIQGLIDLRNEYSGQIWMEVFIIPGINDTIDELTKIKEVLLQINPDKVQLNSLDRPAPEEWVKPAEMTFLEKIREFFLPLNTVIASRMSFNKQLEKTTSDVSDQIVNAITRRPCTSIDLEIMLGVSHDLILESIRVLINEGKIIQSVQETGIFYKMDL